MSPRKVLLHTMTLVLLVWPLVGCNLKEATPTTAPTDTVVPATAVPATAAPTTVAPTVTPTQAVAWQTNDNGRVQFNVGTTSQTIQGDLAPNTTQRFRLNAQKGQQMNVVVITEPVSTEAAPSAFLQITGADGTLLTPSPMMKWSGVLPSTQDYIIDILSATQQPINYQITFEISAVSANSGSGGSTSTTGEMYVPVSASVCQTLQGMATQALHVDFTVQASAPFTDIVSGETGHGCQLTASGNGNNFSDPQSVVQTFLSASGFDEQTAYQAGGPTGAATAATRDTVLMIISANWKPSADAKCPSDQPISNCNLKPEQKIYTVQINSAMYQIRYWLAGHWQDTSHQFTLDLNQAWKNVYGGHSVVAQNGNKIDSGDTSISGMVQGTVATIHFQSSFASGVGTAQITYVDANTIQWKIITPPDGEFYLPAEGTLVRK